MTGKCKCKYDKNDKLFGFCLRCFGRDLTVLNEYEKELISKIEKMKWSDELDDKYEGEEIRRKVHNQALDDVIKLIREE